MRLKPFNVRPGPEGRWLLWVRGTGRVIGPFDTQGEAIDYVYMHWPYWL